GSAVLRRRLHRQVEAITRPSLACVEGLIKPRDQLRTIPHFVGAVPRCRTPRGHIPIDVELSCFGSPLVVTPDRYRPAETFYIELPCNSKALAILRGIKSHPVIIAALTSLTDDQLISQKSGTDTYRAASRCLFRAGPSICFKSDLRTTRGCHRDAASLPVDRQNLRRIQPSRQTLLLLRRKTAR